MSDPSEQCRLPTLGPCERGALLVGAAGVIGWLVSPSGRAWVEALDPLVRSAWIVALGMLAGGVAALLLHRLQRQGLRLSVDGVDVDVPELGTIRLSIDRRQSDVGWRIFIELATRIATQPLERDSGSLDAAIKSLYKLFGTIRDELKTLPARTAPIDGERMDVEGYALLVLNHALRPVLSRWHVRLEEWQRTGQPEAHWPLAQECRAALETTRLELLRYTRGLGEALGVSSIEQLLAPPRAAPGMSRVEPGASQAHAEPALSAAQAAVGWKLYVALATRLPLTSTADGGTTVASVEALAQALAGLLGEYPGPTRGRDRAGSIESTCMALVRDDIAPFLVRWRRLADSKASSGSAVRGRKDAGAAAPDEAFAHEFAALCDAADRARAIVGALIGAEQGDA